MSFQEYQKAPNKLDGREIFFLIIAGVCIILVIYGLAVGNYYLAGKLPAGGEFSLLRTGGRAFLFDRLEPYSGSVAALVQEQVYGRPAQPGEDPYILDIPFYLLVLYFPLALIPDAMMARAFWMALTEIALVGYIFYSFQLMNRQVSNILTVIIAIAGFTSYYVYQAFLDGSPLILLGLASLGILVSLRSEHDELAGALMVFSALQWEISGLFLAFVALWVFWERRWRVYAGLAMFAFVLWVLTFFWYPGWVLPFLRASWNSLRVVFGFSSHALLVNIWPQFGDILGWVLTALLVVTLGYEWRAARHKHFNHFIWVVCLTWAVTPLIGHHLELDQLFPLTMPILLVVMTSRERWKKFGGGIAVVILLFYFGLPWVLLIQGMPETSGLGKEAILFLFWPVFSIFGLFWMRWWVIRAPRTWLDSLTQKDPA